jgi:hypothetical protein
LKPKDFDLAKELKEKLIDFSATRRPLPGLDAPQAIDVFVEQMIESVHRVKYIHTLLTRDISFKRCDPHDPLFDPERAAIFHYRQGNHDEACWLVFLTVFFGKNLRGGWRYLSDTYGRLGEGGLWSWDEVSNNPIEFGNWIVKNQEILLKKNPPGGFGNHRKYVSFKQAPRAIKTYLSWVGESHTALFQQLSAEHDNDSRKTFQAMYRSLNHVYTFGRTGKFDYLTMLGKMQLAPIEPGSAYMTGATGPIEGARLLFSGGTGMHLTPAKLDKWLLELDEELAVGMQVIEDSLCNWQKNPQDFVAFRG